MLYQLSYEATQLAASQFCGLMCGFFNQSEESEVKPKPIVARACTLSRALCRLRVISSSFDWFTGLSPSFLIGQSNYFGFGFTTLDWNSLSNSPDKSEDHFSLSSIKRTSSQLSLHRNFQRRVSGYLPPVLNWSNEWSLSLLANNRGWKRNNE